jgi:hypothetical protein
VVHVRRCAPALPAACLPACLPFNSNFEIFLVFIMEEIEQQLGVHAWQNGMNKHRLHIAHTPYLPILILDRGEKKMRHTQERRGTRPFMSPL